MTKQYKQILRSTATPGEFQIIYKEETLSKEIEDEIAAIKLEQQNK